MLALLFGRLTATFVQFGITCTSTFTSCLIAAQGARNRMLFLFFVAQPVLAGNATQDQLRAFHKVRDDFRSDASKDALYLVVVGIGAFVSTYVFMLIVRIYCVISHCHHGL